MINLESIILTLFSKIDRYKKAFCCFLLCLSLFGNSFEVFSQDQFGTFYRLANKISVLKIDSSENSDRWHSRNYLMFMLINPRLNFVDLASFQKNQIVNAKYENGKLVSGTITFSSSKHGMTIYGDLGAESIAILNRYNVARINQDSYIFPIGFENTTSGRIKHNNKRHLYIKIFNELAKKVNANIVFKLSAVRNNWYIVTDTTISVDDN